jgi:hypothetical protein
MSILVRLQVRAVSVFQDYHPENEREKKRNEARTHPQVRLGRGQGLREERHTMKSTVLPFPHSIVAVTGTAHPSRPHLRACL